MNRKTISVKGLNKTACQKIAMHVDELIVAKRSGMAIDAQTASWLSKLSQSIHDRLSGLGLVEPRLASTLGEFLNLYVQRRTDVKHGTKLNYDRVVKNMI